MNQHLAPAPSHRHPTGRAFAAAVALALASCLGASLAQAAPLKLRLLATTDIHMNLVNYDYYQDKGTEQFGLAKTATLIKAARAEAKNHLLIDNGDLIQGSPMGEVVARVRPLQPGEVHPAFKVMNSLKYDAANVGNHEFNYGLPFLAQSLKTASFPYVSANVVDQHSGKPLLAPYVLLKREFIDEDGKKRRLTVGVIGFAPPQITVWDKMHLAGKVRSLDIVDTARKYIPEMKRRGADIIVAVPHSGFDRTPPGAMAENAVASIAEIAGVDAILFGHAHLEFPSPAFKDFPKVNLDQGTINGVAAVMPGRWGDHLGVVDLTLERVKGKWQVQDRRGEIRPIWDRKNRKPLVEADAAVLALAEPAHQATLEFVRGRVAETAAPIYSYFAQVADDPSVQLVSQAQIWYAKNALKGTEHEKLPILSAAAPFKAGGRQGWSYYTDIPVGPLAIKHLADLYIYPNTLKVVKVNGRELREWLERSAGQFSQIDPKGALAQNLINDEFPSFNFDTIDGVTYQIDVTQAARHDKAGKALPGNSSRIVNLAFEGKPVQDDMQFLVVSNNYRAEGGGNFAGLNGKQIVFDAPDENRDALARYMASEKTVNPSSDNNWQILPVPGISLRFATGAGALRYLPRHPGLKLVSENADGSVTLELVK